MDLRREGQGTLGTLDFIPCTNSALEQANPTCLLHE